MSSAMVDPRSPTDTAGLSVAVIDAVSAALGVEPETLDPLLHDAIDPDALDALFAGRDGTRGHIRFQYHGYLVDVDGEGNVTLEAGDHAAPVDR